MEDEKSEKPMIKFIGFFYLCAMRVAFTGHRDYSGTTNEKLREVIIALYEVGYNTFLCGMAEGFDIAAAEIVLSLKCELNGLKLQCVVPFRGHEFTMPDRDWAERYKRVIESADEVVTISQTYNVEIYRQRNDYLVDNADALICYYSGKARSGTGYTVRRALKKCIQTINLYADSYQIQFFG